jgi:propionyl-CoA carboxylase alpha chain
MTNVNKLIIWLETLKTIQIMIKAIEDYHVEGVQTTLPLGNCFLNVRTFRSGKLCICKITTVPEML